MSMRLYFAHPVTDYGGERQRSAIAALERYWREERSRQTLEIENPDQPHHQVGYAAHGMAYFKDLLKTCHSLAFMRFPNGAIGAGVGNEIKWALIGCLPVYEIFEGHLYSIQDIPTPILTVEETRSLIAEIRSDDLMKSGAS